MATLKQEEIVEIIKKYDLKVTEHRLAILTRVAKSKTPIAAHKLIEDLKKHIDIDQATVYRNLVTLEESGVIRRYDYNHGHAHYELSDQHEPKHQIVCSNCETIENIANNVTLDEALKKMLRKSKKFKNINQETVQIYGLCKNCA